MEKKKCNHSHSRGKLIVVGIGPGSHNHLTHRAEEVIKSCDVLMGYRTYLRLIIDLIKDQVVISYGMGEEVKRCKKAMEYASKGKKVVLVSSGDPGIYGMAGPVYEVLNDKFNELKNLEFSVEVVPGVPAFCAAAAGLGAPLMSDFVLISLSDLLIPWEKIEKRIMIAAQGDFVICLYNPKSKKRVAQIKKAQKILLEFRKGETPVGIVKNAGRHGESIVVTNLKDMANQNIDMVTTIIIGSSHTFTINDLMVTKRGYLEYF